MVLTLWENTWVDAITAIDLTYERIDLAEFRALLEDVDERADASLVQAYRSLKRLTFFVPEFSAQKPEPFRVGDLTQDERNTLPDDFLYVIRMGQVLEADSLLGTNPSMALEVEAAKRRRAGIIEETIGESTTKFSSLGGNASSQSVAGVTANQRTLNMLSPYLYRTVRLART